MGDLQILEHKTVYSRTRTRGVHGKLCMQNLLQNHQFPFTYRDMQATLPSWEVQVQIRYYDPFRHFVATKQKRKSLSHRSKI